MADSNPDRFKIPAINDESGFCVSCGRDNHGYPNSPCANECPMYWEEIGIPHPDYPGDSING